MDWEPFAQIIFYIINRRACERARKSQRIDADMKRKRIRQINNEYSGIDICVHKSFPHIRFLHWKSREIFVNLVNTEIDDLRYAHSRKKKWFEKLKIPLKRRNGFSIWCEIMYNFLVGYISSITLYLKWTDPRLFGKR